jgi:hypothetical protein
MIRKKTQYHQKDMLVYISYLQIHKVKEVKNNIFKEAKEEQIIT